MRSFAVWYSSTIEESKKGSNSVLSQENSLDANLLLELPSIPEANNSQKESKQVSIHINLWNKPKEDKYCFDFGLMVEDIRGIENIYLYCPFEITEQEKKQKVKDLGIIISNHNLVNAIFNENFTTTNGEPKRLIVNSSEQSGNFVIYSLEVGNQITITNLDEDKEDIKPGTVLAIDLKNINPNEIYRYYFRIRVEAFQSQLDFIEDDIKGVSMFNNSFTNTEIIDFRLNDTRSFREELKERFYDGEKFAIRNINYLILRDANDSIIHFGDNINSRMLEKKIWNKYIESDERKIIAYHIKKKAKMNSSNEICYIEDFTNLSRFQYQKKTSTVLILYIFGIIILGAVGSIVANIIWGFMGL